MKHKIVCLDVRTGIKTVIVDNIPSESIARSNLVVFQATALSHELFSIEQPNLTFSPQENKWFVQYDELFS